MEFGDDVGAVISAQLAPGHSLLFSLVEILMFCQIVFMA
jgi:hypothetical protein